MPNLCNNLLTIKSRNKRLLEEIKDIPEVVVDEEDLDDDLELLEDLEDL